MTIRVGIIGTDNGHAAIFAGNFNGWSDDVPTPVRAGNYFDPFYHYWQYHRAELTLLSGQPGIVAGATVTRIWSNDPSAASTISTACSIPTVCSTPEQVCEDVDAVMVLSEDPASHPVYARLALERGLPTFVDKPIAPDVAGCEEIYELARRHGAKVFTSSALRWSPELVATRRAIDDVYRDALLSVYVKVPNRLALYGIHAVEMVNGLLGHDVVEVQGVQEGAHQIATLRFASGQIAIIDTFDAQARPSYCFVAYLQRHTLFVDLRELAMAFARLQQAFVDMAAGGDVPVMPEETMTLMRIVYAAQQACETGRVVQVVSR